MIFKASNMFIIAALLAFMIGVKFLDVPVFIIGFLLLIMTVEAEELEIRIKRGRRRKK